MHPVVFILDLNADEKHSNDDVTKKIEDSITHLFSLWTLPCSEWLNVFSCDAVWYHPKFPNGLQYNQLKDFCEINQATKPALFRQDGQIRLTISGTSSLSLPLYHVMVPYVYGQIENGNNNSLFINSGYEYVELAADQNNAIRINRVVEFFNRASLPFVWPDNN
ncbi:unnamed protein product [Adineta steineri]|uniref:Uncharacterized protein n=1 Tax=Adineta steineri TaxID=433720 RepID=A0A819QNH9_9BILA|nr:unnamed protein product [Adineta steineri]